MSEDKAQAAIDSVLREDRVFSPPESFAADAYVPSREHYNELYRRSVEDPSGFWGEMAARLRWSTPWQRVLDWIGRSRKKWLLRKLLFKKLL